MTKVVAQVLLFFVDVVLIFLAIHEAKSAAQSLGKEGIPYRLEIVRMDRDFHRYGNGALGTRMILLVHPRDCKAARKAVAYLGPIR